MALSKKQQKNADRLKKAIEKDDDDAMEMALLMGKAAREGDTEELERLERIAQQRGWIQK